MSETHTFVGKTPLIGSDNDPLYDADGNTLRDERWRYTWDAENRLIALTTLPEAIAAGAPDITIKYKYDSQNRRFLTETDTRAAAGVTVERRAFIYDGWNVIAEYASHSAAGPWLSTTWNLWGLDISGSLQGAGGIGGLLYRSD